MKVYSQHEITNNQDTSTKQISMINNQSPNKALHKPIVWLLGFGYWSLFGYCFLVFGYSAI